MDTWSKRFAVHHRVLGLVRSFFLAIFPLEKGEASLPSRCLTATNPPFRWVTRISTSSRLISTFLHLFVLPAVQVPSLFLVIFTIAKSSPTHMCARFFRCTGTREGVVPLVATGVVRTVVRNMGPGKVGRVESAVQESTVFAMWVGLQRSLGTPTYIPS